MNKPKSYRVWWKAYRRRQNRLQKCLSTEMIMRRAFIETFREYADNCAINGFQHMWNTKSGMKQRLSWGVVFICVMLSMIYFLHYIWNESLSKPLVVTMDSSNYPISKIDFPAIAICNINRISMKTLINYTKTIYQNVAKQNESFAELLAFTSQLGRLLDFTYNPYLSTSFLEAFDAQLNDTHEIIEIMKMLAPSCDEMLLKCYWGGLRQKCGSLFRVRRTTLGHCCVFNYILDYESADLSDRTLDAAKQQRRASKFYGLTVFIDAKFDDYTYNLYNRKGVEIMIFDPTNFPDPNGGRVIQRTAQPSQGALVKLLSTKQIATGEVRKYPPSTRKCLFHDEKHKEFNSKYSYSACIVKCRVKSMQSLCKCTPYYLPISSKYGRVCTLNDLRCLNKYNEKFFSVYPMGETNFDGLEIEEVDSLNCSECLPDCEHTEHFTEHSKYPLSDSVNQEKLFSDFFISNVNLTETIVVSIYQSTNYGILNRLDVVSYWFEILSSIGGFYGILVGYSIITLPELGYFFIFRFSVRVYNFYMT